MTTVWGTLMITLKFFFRNEVNSGVIRFEVCWHAHDFLADAIVVGCIGNNIDDPVMSFGFGQSLTIARACLINGILRRDSVLDSAFDPLNLTYRIRVTLGKAFAPERVLHRLREQAEP